MSGRLVKTSATEWYRYIIKENGMIEKRKLS